METEGERGTASDEWSFQFIWVGNRGPILPIAIKASLAIRQAMRLIIVSAVFVALGAVIAFRKPKPGKESLDWLGGFISGGAMIALFAALMEYLTRR